MSSSAKKIITLKSSKGKLFKVKKAVALKSKILADVIKNCPDDKPIPLPNVTSKILTKVIKYCERPDDDLNACDQELAKGNQPLFDLVVDQRKLFGLMEAANYLEIPGLSGETYLTVANMIKGKTPEQLRKTFNIKNDFTPEEEEEIRRENQ